MATFKEIAAHSAYNAIFFNCTGLPFQFFGGTLIASVPDHCLLLSTFLSTPGPSCSKLTMLINDLLKFQMAILQIHCYFLLKKCENLRFSHLFNKKITVYLLYCF